MTDPNRLHALAHAIHDAGLDAYLVPMADEFQGEYIPAYAARLPYLTGFDGSAGLGLFWAKLEANRRHTLLVDGRYTLQAAQQVDASILDVHNSGEVTIAQCLGTADAPLAVGFDPWLTSEHQREQWQRARTSHPIIWQAVPGNLVDRIWAEQPAPPAGDVHVHPLAFAGVDYAHKRAAVLAIMRANNADSLVLTEPDSINWLLNIRGADVPFNPLLLAHMLLRADGTAILFMHPHRLDDALVAYFAEQRVTIAPLADVFENHLSADIFGQRVMLDKTTVAAGWFSLVTELRREIIVHDDPTSLAKACKNPTELSGTRAAHQRDGLALTRFLYWFDEQNLHGRPIDELTAIDHLEQCRRGDNAYRGPSFATIAGSGPNGAIVHYRANARSNRRSRSGELFLLDSGGQYADGTTDVTRTMFVTSPAGGSPAPLMREHFTRVLKGHIALASARFPAGTTGSQLDSLARQYLWQAGLDYDHGTGHGVGSYLCVHEGPQGISKRAGGVALMPGMILSNEPGYYAAGHYGIRIENLVVVVEAGQMLSGKPMLAFETITLAPIDTRLVDVAMLSSDERNWLNAYHRRVHDAHANGLASEARRWLMQATRAI